MSDLTTAQGVVVTRAKASVHELPQECDLTNEMIKQFLQNAETRLKGLENWERKVIYTASSNDTKSPVGYASSGVIRPLHSYFLRLPRLDPGQITKPYVASLGDIAQADAVRLVDDQMRQLSNTARDVEDPVSYKIRASKVRSALLHPPRTLMRKIFPINT